MNRLALKLPHQRIIPYKICNIAQIQRQARCGGILPRARTAIGRSCGPSLGFMPVQGVQGRMQTFQHSVTVFRYGVQGVQGTITRFLHFYFSVSIN